MKIDHRDIAPVLVVAALIGLAVLTVVAVMVSGPEETELWNPGKPILPPAEAFETYPTPRSRDETSTLTAMQLERDYELPAMQQPVPTPWPDHEKFEMIMETRRKLR